MTFTPGTRLGPYEIHSARDLPGLGEVYDARDHDQQRNIAFRVLRADFAADPDRLRRFEQEARAAALLAHPNILTVHDVGTDAQAAYVISEPIEGATLRDSLNRGALPVATAAAYALQVAQGLAAAHEKGIVHRDLKPENILVTPDGGVKVIGFGLAAATQDESALARGVPLGTPSYMSPEQVRGDAVNQRSDMFSFGAIVYEMLTGTRAFSGATPIDTITAVLQWDPPPPSAPDIPPILSRVVDLSLKKKPGSRLSADDVVIGLQGIGLQGIGLGPVIADDAVPVPEAPRRPRRLGRVAALIGVIAIAALAGPWLLRAVRGPSTAATPPPATPAPRTATPTPRPLPPTPTPAPAPAVRPVAPAPAAPRPVAPTPAAPARPAAAPPTPAPSAATPTRSFTPAASPPPVPPMPPPSTPPRAAAGAQQQSQLVWFDREGKELGRVGDAADYGDVSLSPDGMRVAVSVRERGSDAADIWVFDVASGMRTRLTSDPADDIAPVWSPDGQRILFASSRKGSLDIYQKSVSAAGDEVAIVDAPGDQISYDWSADGDYLIYQTNQPRVIAGGNLDLGARPLPTGRPFAYLRTVHAASRATFSPDASWVAYTSLENGRDDVYIARFPRYDGRRRISTGGGSWSRWRRDGSEMFYLDPENRLMAVPLKQAGTGFEVGTALPLFRMGAKPNRGYAYDVSVGGRILVNRPVP